MSSKVFSNAEEQDESWLRTKLDLNTSYKPSVRKTPAEISRGKNARVIPIKEENENRARWLRLHFGPLIPKKTSDSMTPAEILSSQQKMQIEIERENASKKVKQILQQYNELPNPFKKIETYVKKNANKVKKNVKDYFSPPTIMKPLGRSKSPPHSIGGYNYRKYKYTNITKKPTKPKILAKNPQNLKYWQKNQQSLKYKKIS